MSPSLQIDGIITFVGVVVCIMAAYRSFAIRQALRNSVYRSHALWTGIAATLFVVVQLPTAIYEVTGIAVLRILSVTSVSYSSSLDLVIELFFFLGLIFLVIFAWFDRTIEVALYADYFHRDILYWKRGARKVFWAALFVLLVSELFAPPAGILYWEGALALVICYVAAVLAIGAGRAKDRAIRSYAKWVGLVVVTVVVLLPIYPYNSPSVLSAYFLYRATGSLSPMSKIEKEAE